MKIEPIGSENVPVKGPFILVCNHRSGIDPSVVSAVIPRYIAWLTASYMRKIPLMSWIIRKTGMILIDVNGVVAPSSMKNVIQVLNQGEVVGIFPEGEQYIFNNDFGAPLSSFHKGFAVVACKMKVPVLPVVICPVKEKIVDIKIPHQLREDIGKHHDLNKIRKMVKYQQIKVVIGEAIQVKPAEGKGQKTSVEELLDQVRNSMLQMKAKYQETNLS